MPFFDAPADVWRCAWCSKPAPSKEALQAAKCHGAPLHFRMFFKQLKAEHALNSQAEPAREHTRWKRGPWTWCSVCCGISSVRLKILAGSCLAAPLSTRQANVKRLIEGWSPYGPKSRLPDERPQRLKAGRWIDDVYADAAAVLRRSFRECLARGRGESDIGLLDADLPVTFASGFRAARSLVERLAFTAA